MRLNDENHEHMHDTMESYDKTFICCIIVYILMNFHLLLQHTKIAW